jgi:hypothetical protein
MKLAQTREISSWSDAAGRGPAVHDQLRKSLRMWPE